MKIDINEISDIKKLLHQIKTDEPLTISENYEEKYIVLTTEAYDELEASAKSNSVDLETLSNANIQVIGPENLELSQEDLEELKETLLDFIEDKIASSKRRS